MNDDAADFLFYPDYHSSHGNEAFIHSLHVVFMQLVLAVF